MVHDHLLLVLSLLFAVGGLHMLSVKLKVSFPIPLVLRGLPILRCQNVFDNAVFRAKENELDLEAARLDDHG